jgi:hypothetical protein
MEVISEAAKCLLSPCLSGWRRHTNDAQVSNYGTYNFWTFEIVPCIQSRASPSAHKNKNKNKNKNKTVL